MDDQSPVIAFLSSPATHGTKDPVQVLETHGALVFLAGPHALKIKRAVHYDYMDFSTVDRRRQARADDQQCRGVGRHIGDLTGHGLVDPRQRPTREPDPRHTAAATATGVSP